MSCPVQGSCSLFQERWALWALRAKRPRKLIVSSMVHAMGSFSTKFFERRLNVKVILGLFAMLVLWYEVKFCGGTRC